MIYYNYIYIYRGCGRASHRQFSGIWPTEIFQGLPLLGVPLPGEASPRRDNDPDQRLGQSESSRVGEAASESKLYYIIIYYIILYHIYVII